jgi:outer membrane immunogenic protein
MALAALMVSPAFAADLPRQAPPPLLPPAPVYNWSGCYIGANGGWARAETRVSFLGLDDFSRSASGGAIGGQIGCDYQFYSNWVIGVQGMLDWTDIEATRTSVLFPNTEFRARVRGFGTISARLGYAVTPSFLLYGKVGWGAYETRFTANDVLTGVELGSTGRTQSGFDLGIGGEWMFAPNWSLFIEYDHIFPQDKTVFFPNLAGGTTADIRREFDKVLVGVNWRFGGFAAPVSGAY